MSIRISRVHSIYFSPAGSTAKITNRVSDGIGKTLEVPTSERRFTVPGTRVPMDFGEEDLVVIGLPTYAGRLPNKIAPYVKSSIHGDSTIAVAVTTYGNRSYDSSLDELKFILQENGFTVVAAGAFPCRHVFSDVIAEGRPDVDDLNTAIEFGRHIADKIRAAQDPESLRLPLIEELDIKPYYQPLKQDGTPASFLKAVPKTDMSKCYMCGHCVEACPMGVIDKNDCVTIKGPCIKCQACVTRCTAGAKYFDDPDFLSHVRMLEENYGPENSLRKAPNLIDISTVFI